MKENLSKFDAVYEVVKKIPYGRVTTYGAIADYLDRCSPRMVGWALNGSFSREFIPAHRVINRNGELTGRHHFPTPTMMQELLENEQIKIKDFKVINFKELFWSPTENLGS
jgi:methylated-DNA-protein-cysteine methyltransferase-like protein